MGRKSIPGVFGILLVMATAEALAQGEPTAPSGLGHLGNYCVQVQHGAGCGGMRLCSEQGGYGCL